MGLVLQGGIQKNRSSSGWTLAGSPFPLGQGFHPALTNITIVLFPLRMTSHPGICLKLSQIHQKIHLLSPLLCPGEAPSAVLCPVLGSPVQERGGAAGESPVEGYEDEEGMGASLL